MQRAVDVALAGGALVLVSPILGVAAAAVKLGDGGPVLFRQTRVGKDGVDFELLKLRTMVVDAERQGAGFAVDKGDARITRAARVLRCATRSSVTTTASGDASTSCPASPAGRRSTGVRHCRGTSASSST